MELWKILVCGVVRLDLNEDYDRLHELVNHHPGGHLKFLHLWPGQTPPPLAAGRGDFSLVNRAWQPESVAV